MTKCDSLNKQSPSALINFKCNLKLVENTIILLFLENIDIKQASKNCVCYVKNNI